MAGAGADKRSVIFAAAAVSLLCLLAQAPPAGAATNPGGTAPAGGAAPAGGVSTPTASPHVKTVRIASVKCVPVGRCSANPRQVSLRGTLLIAGPGLASGMVVAFPRTPGARISRASPGARLRKTAAGLEVTVPASAHSGNIMVLLGKGRHTSSYGPISIVRYALHPPAPKDPPQPVSTAPGGSAFEGQGMWIWYLSQSNGGSLPAIVAQAHAAGVTTLFVKSSDGSSSYWSQFSPALVSQLHASGLKVCAWQYVYGTNPAGEASLGAKAVASGADCLVIDAEAEYEGRYGAAQTYVADLRAKIGPGYPLGLASFPYVYYHTSFPYSVFLGPNGAQFNAPQMYWKDIGVSVDTIYANTYIANRIYGHPIMPLGQTYNRPSNAELVRFRAEAVDYGATGLSWWDWQETPGGEWTALAAPLSPLTSVTPNPGYSELAQGSRGDPVLWMQEHLASAIPGQATTGIFDATTTANLKRFQAAHAIAPSGKTEAATWQALLALPPVSVSWTGGGPSGA
ncbi:MAG TPA: peptidoglycan-binding domain-containing protein [Solirubrobacteraceae bacterium]|nr:peptidoglycan-binding domain-containing protein [Solirubrobacteraceae bacterium]